jgi:hypothetical protein
LRLDLALVLLIVAFLFLIAAVEPVPSGCFEQGRP